MLYLLLFLCACQLDIKVPHKTNTTPAAEHTTSYSDKENNIIINRIEAPKNYKRTIVNKESYGHFLRHLKLKPKTAEVKYYNGEIKKNHHVYCAVVDLDIGKKNLHQCADAIMRLKAEYHWNRKEFDKIHFNFTNGFKVEYTKWMKGNRIQVNANNTTWAKTAEPSNTYNDFWKYLETIFTYAGTASLEKELIKVKNKEIEIGDVLIQGGHPGHALAIVDKVKNENTGKSLYLLAQSYMPAQETQILINPDKKEISPWYDLDTETIITPEWEFSIDNLKRFVD